MAARSQPSGRPFCCASSEWQYRWSEEGFSVWARFLIGVLQRLIAEFILLDHD
jgi:hypothetical protein